MASNPATQSIDQTAEGQHQEEIPGEKPLKREDVPAPVLKTIDREALGVRILGYSLGTYENKPIYVVHSILNRSTHTLSKDFLVDEKGAIRELREQVELPALPSRLRDGIIKHAAGAKIERVDAITKDGVLAYFVAQLSKEGKHSEIRVNSIGGLMTPPAPSPVSH